MSEPADHAPDVGLVHRLVHRYVGREHGGHRAVAGTFEPDPALERLVQRRSDLAGEDLGRAVPPYLCGYPLGGGGYALARTRYLTDADCLGAVRTETLVLDARARAAAEDPLALAAALASSPEAPDELARWQQARALVPLAPLPLAVEPACGAAARLAPLRALEPGLRRLVLAAVAGPRPVVLLGEPGGAQEGAPEAGGGAPAALALLRALLHLRPAGRAWDVAFCAQALSPRPWAELSLAPAAAADRFALRAAREGDLALVDLARGAARNVEHGPEAETLERLVAGDLEALAGLVRRAGPIEAYRGPTDLVALARAEALALATAPAPEETIELSNLLRARGAPEAEAVAPLRRLLLDPPPDRLPWVANVLRAGWLPWRRGAGAPPGPAQEAERAAAARLAGGLARQGRFDLACALVADLGPLADEAARAAREVAAAALAAGADPGAGEPPLGPRGGHAPADSAGLAAAAGLALDAAAAAPARWLAPVLAGLARRGPLAPDLLVRAVELALAPSSAAPADRATAALAALDATAAARAWRLAGDLLEGLVDEAGRTAWVDDALLARAYARVATLEDAGPAARALARHPLARPRPLEALLRAAARRGPPGRLRACGQALVERVRGADDLARAGRALLRLDVLARRAGAEPDAAPGAGGAAVAGLPALRAALLERAVARALARPALGLARVLERALRLAKRGAWSRAAQVLEAAAAAGAGLDRDGAPAAAGAPPERREDARGTGVHDAAALRAALAADDATGARGEGAGGAEADAFDPEGTGAFDRGAVAGRTATEAAAGFDPESTGAFDRDGVDDRATTRAHDAAALLALAARGGGDARPAAGLALGADDPARTGAVDREAVDDRAATRAHDAAAFEAALAEHDRGRDDPGGPPAAPVEAALDAWARWLEAAARLAPFVAEADPDADAGAARAGADGAGERAGADGAGDGAAAARALAAAPEGAWARVAPEAIARLGVVSLAGGGAPAAADGARGGPGRPADEAASRWLDRLTKAWRVALEARQGPEASGVLAVVADARPEHRGLLAAGLAHALAGGVGPATDEAWLALVAPTARALAAPPGGAAAGDAPPPLPEGLRADALRALALEAALRLARAPEPAGAAALAVDLATLLDHPAVWRAALDLALRGLEPARAGAAPPATPRAALAGAAARAIAALGPDLAHAPPLLELVARRAHEGALDLSALAPLGPPLLDQALTPRDDRFSLRLQAGLRAFVLAQADGPPAPDRRELLRVALARLAPLVAPDRAFRVELAQALRARLPAEDAAALRPAIDAFAR